MTLQTPAAPHIHAKISVSKIMLTVVLAMLPAMLAWTWFFGWGLLVHMFIAITTALASEAACLQARNKPVKPALMDGSALVTAILVAFCIPSLAPWWTTVIGTLFAIIIAKQLYGGLGMNPFNPAMAGYVMLLISFPREMTAWLPAMEISRLGLGLPETASVVFNLSSLPDTLTSASPLDAFRTALTQGDSTLTDTRFTGQEWIWINIAFLAGGLFLLIRKIINWHIPLTMLASLLILSGIFFFMDPQQHLSPFMHLFSGATMIGAFFIATDPVTASTTPRGRLIYGAGIGVLTYVIRAWGGYPDAVAFAVLLMNIAAPTIDYYTRPRVFGDRNES